jgi:hypothetical protein
VQYHGELPIVPGTVIVARVHSTVPGKAPALIREFFGGLENTTRYVAFANKINNSLILHQFLLKTFEVM